MGSLPAKGTVNGFAVDSGNPKTMYVVARDGFLKSTDAGETWKAEGKGLKNLAAVIVNPKKPNEIYTSTVEGTILVSTDGGINWKRQP